jgi:anti-sigma regulatory factor (Ser/Thr protein kinase)
MERFRGRLSDRSMEDARLLVSELVTNSLRHAPHDAAKRIGLVLSCENEVLRAEVSDHGPGFVAAPRSPGASEEAGWGLYLVARLADRWGVDHSEGETTVWFEIDTGPRQG